MSHIGHRASAIARLLRSSDQSPSESREAALAALKIERRLTLEEVETMLQAEIHEQLADASTLTDCQRAYWEGLRTGGFTAALGMVRRMLRSEAT